MFKKFDKDDILHNVLIANPKVSVRIFNGNLYNNFTLVATEPTSETYEPRLDFSDGRNSMYIPLT
jgi:hypothetical protein